jgi:hypothetical protein
LNQLHPISIYIVYISVLLVVFQQQSINAPNIILLCSSNSQWNHQVAITYVVSFSGLSIFDSPFGIL